MSKYAIIVTPSTPVNVDRWLIVPGRCAKVDTLSAISPSVPICLSYKESRLESLLMPPQSTNAVTVCPLWSSTSTSKTLARKRSKRRKHCNRMVLRVIETHSTIIGFDSGKILLVGSSIGGV